MPLFSFHLKVLTPCLILTPHTSYILTTLCFSLRLSNLLIRRLVQHWGSPWNTTGFPQLQNFGVCGGDSSRAVACRWLQGHEDVWKPWLPDPTKCFSGSGLYHPTSNSFVSLGLWPKFGEKQVGIKTMLGQAFLNRGYSTTHWRDISFLYSYGSYGKDDERP